MQAESNGNPRVRKGLRVSMRGVTVPAPVFAVMIGFIPLSAHAQSVQDLPHMIEQQQELFKKQAEEMRVQQEAIEAMRRQLNRLETNEAAQSAVAKRGEARVTPKASPPAPGFIQVGNSDTWFKLGGFVQTQMFYFPEASSGESEDYFLPQFISTDSSPAVERSRVRLSARTSRFNTDFRTFTDVGTIRGYMEMDFFGEIQPYAQSSFNGYDPRLRHAFIEWTLPSKRYTFLAGQYWSNFEDPSTYADFTNPVPLGRIFIRQPQVRVTTRLADSLSLAVAIENPQGDIAGGGGAGASEQFDRYPDVTASLRYSSGWGSAYLASLARWAEETTPTKVSEFLYGVSASARIKTPLFGEGDNIKGEVTIGNGVGRYLADLGATFDGYLTPEGDMEKLDILAIAGAFQHHWSAKLRSNFGGSYVDVDGVGAAPTALPANIDKLMSVSTNIVYQPVQPFSLALEYNWGQRKDTTGQDGTASVLLFSSTYTF